jgi:hypothetical protein
LVSGLRSLFRGAPETAVNGFVNTIVKAKGDLAKSCRVLFERIPNNRLFKIRIDDVRNASGLYSPLMQTYLAFLYANEAKSWPSGRLLSHVLHEKTRGEATDQFSNIAPERATTGARLNALGEARRSWHSPLAG